MQLQLSEVSPDLKGIIIFGAGGHAPVVSEIARACGFEVRAIYDDNPASVGKSVAGVAVAGRIADLPDSLTGNAFIAIGNNSVRRSLCERFAGLTWPLLIHPHARVSSLASLGDGSLVCAGAVVQPNAIIGRQVIVNIGACVDHDSRVGDFCHIGAMAYVPVNSEIGAGSHLQPGSRPPFAARMPPGSVIA